MSRELAMVEIWQRDAWELADAVRAGEVSATDLCEAHLARVDAFEADLNAWTQVDHEGALAQAAAIDRRVAAGEDPGLLAGVPLGVKETTAARGLSYTHGSRLYEGEVADHDDTQVARLRDAGAVVVGKTTAPEFGSTNWTRTRVFGTTRNPWNPERTPGGSSGGSAAAVAAGMVPIATGGDGGGSIRIPSAYSGLFGFKVSFGRIGHRPDSFDTALTAVPGPMCRSVRDAARYVDVVAGPTVTDATSLARPTVSYEEQMVSGAAVERLRGRRAVWTSTLGFATCDPVVEQVTHEAALALAADAGLELVDVAVDLPRPGRAWAVLSSLDMAWQHGERAAGRHDELTPVVRAGLEMVEEAPVSVILHALRRRHELLTAIAAVFDDVDLILSPTTATVAFAAEGPPPMEIAGKPVGGMGSVPFTPPFNISGQPAVSIPCGAVEGLPVGLQVVTRRHDEELVLAAGLVAEARRPWPKLAPGYERAV